jgi:biotin-[acetyl-CoA-carboxylase] ligase BirA-like protein
MIPQVLSLIQRTFTGMSRGRAMSAYSAVLAGGVVVGQIVGGFLVSADLLGTTWRPVFLVNVPIGVVLLVAGWRKLPAGSGERGRGLDLPGLVTLTPAVLALVVPLVLGQSEHWPAWGWACLAASPVALAGFVFAERRQAAHGGSPLIPGRVLALPGVASGIAALFATMTVFGGFFFALALHLQGGLGDSPLRAGLTFAPSAAAFAAVSLNWQRLPGLVRRWLPIGGFAWVAAGLASLAGLLHGGGSGGIALYLVLALIGAGMAAAFSPLMTAVLMRVPVADAADATGVIVTVNQLGLVIGVATFGTLYLNLAGRLPARTPSGNCPRTRWRSPAWRWLLPPWRAARWRCCAPRPPAGPAEARRRRSRRQRSRRQRSRPCRPRRQRSRPCKSWRRRQRQCGARLRVRAVQTAGQPEPSRAGSYPRLTMGMNRVPATAAGPPLSAAALQAALVRPGSLWREVHVVAETGSTNEDLLAAAGRGAPAGTVLAAEAQNDGRGRMGRSWVSVPGASLTFSVLLRPAAVPPASRGWVPLLTGVAVTSALRAVARVDARLKWPNDVLVNGAKVAGILAEQAGDAVVVGAGINVLAGQDELPSASATSLALLGASGTDRQELLAGVLGELERWYLRWTHASAGDTGNGDGRNGDAELCGLRQEYLRLCSTVGIQVRVTLPGGQALTGTACDVDRSGRLVIRSAGELICVSAGDVEHVR